MDTVEQAYTRLRPLPFPRMPADDDLAAIVAHMSEVDGELAIWGGRAARGEPISPEGVPPVRGLVTRLWARVEVPVEDAESFAATVDSLEALTSPRDALLAP